MKSKNRKFFNLAIILNSIFFIILFTYCSNNEHKNSDSSNLPTIETYDNIPTDEAESINYLSPPISIYGSDYSLFKILIKTESYQSKLHKRAGYIPEICTNVLFYNLQSSEYRLLYSKPVNVVSIDYPNNKHAIIKDFILYQVISEDINKDELLDAHDNDILYSSDINGNDFRRITDLNANVISYNKLKDDKLLIIQSIPEKNKSEDEWLRKTILYDLGNNQFIENKFDLMLDKSKKIFESLE